MQGRPGDRVTGQAGCGDRLPELAERRGTDNAAGRVDRRTSGRAGGAERGEVRRFRRIPASGRIVVKEGDEVQPHTMVAKIEALPGRLLRVNVSGALGVEPASIVKWMLKGPGERVEEGETLAARADFFERRAARSPVDGVVSIVSRNLGYCYVREITELGESSEPVTVEASKILKIAPNELDRFKAPGTRPGAIVPKGQILASVRRGARSLDVATSPIYGRIREVSLADGTVTISPLFRSLDVKAYLAGRVTAVALDRSVEITGRAVVLEGKWGVGAEACGQLQLVAGSLPPGFKACPGAIVALDGTLSYDEILSLAEAGASGAVVSYLSSETVLELVGPRGNLGVTGDEDPPVPVVVMEGFAPARMKDDTFAVLKERDGAPVSITGVTHIRAGVIRPEVVICCE